MPNRELTITIRGIDPAKMSEKTRAALASMIEAAAREMLMEGDPMLHAVIGRRDAGGKITAIYCHSSGDPEGVGQRLHLHYRDPEKVDALIALGDLVSLGEEIGIAHPVYPTFVTMVDGGADWFDTNMKISNDYNTEYGRMCRAFGRDGGDEGHDAVVVEHDEALLHLARYHGALYAYLYHDGCWHVFADDEGGAGTNWATSRIGNPPSWRPVYTLVGLPRDPSSDPLFSMFTEAKES